MKILVVEDSALVRDRVIALLNAIDGVSVVGYAEDAAPAIATIDAVHPDLVVLDITLKTSNGRDVLKHVVRTCPQTPVYMLSNQASEPVRGAFLRNGAARFFDKTSDIIAFRDAVVALAANRRRTR